MNLCAIDEDAGFEIVKILELGKKKNLKRFSNFGPNFQLLMAEKKRKQKGIALIVLTEKVVSILVTHVGNQMCRVTSLLGDESCQQHLKMVTNIESSTYRCHQNHCRRLEIVTLS